MANVNSTLGSSPGSVQEASGFRRQMVIDWQDVVAAAIDSTTDADTVTFQMPVFAGEEVTHVGVKLVTAFNDSGGGDELDIIVGDGTDPNGYIETAALHVDQTEITYVSNTGDLVDANAEGDATKLYVADDTIDMLLTPDGSTGTPYNLNELTVGRAIVTVIGNSYIG